MPNDCDNIIIITGDSENFFKFKETLNGPDSNGEHVFFSFFHTVKNNNINTTQTFDVRDLFSGKADIFLNNGIWGTKWDVYDVEIITNNDKEVRIQCHTAWTPPIKWAQTAHKNWNIDIAIHYNEEGVGFYGTYEINKYGVSNKEYRMKDNRDYDEEKDKVIRTGVYKEFYDTWFNNESN